MGRILNSITGEQEDSQLPDNSAILDVLPVNDPSLSNSSPDSAFDKAKNVLKPGEYFSGSSTPGVVATNSAGAASALGVDLAVEQAKAAKEQAKMVQEQIAAQRAGSPLPVALQATHDELKKALPAPPAPGQSKPYETTGEKIPTLVAKMKNAAQWGTGEIVDPSSAQWGAVEKQLRQQGDGAVVKQIKDKITTFTQMLEDEKAANPTKYTDAQSWMNFVKAAGIPEAFQKTMMRYAAQNAPASVQAVDAGIISGRAKVAESGVMAEEARKQSLATFQQNQDMAKDANATSLLDWSNIAMPNSTAEERQQMVDLYKTGDASKLSLQTADFYRQKIADFTSETPMMFEASTQGVSKRDVSSLERTQMRIDAQMRRGDKLIGSGLDVGSVVRAGRQSTGRSVSEIKTQQAGQQAEQHIDEQANLIGVDSKHASTLKMLGGAKPDLGFDLGSRAFGIDPKADYPVGIATSTKSLATDTKAMYDLVSEAIDAGKSPESPEILAKVKSYFSGEKDPNKARLMAGESLNAAITQKMTEADSAWNQKADEFMNTTRSQAAEIAYNGIKNLIGKSPLVQARAVEDFIRRAAPSALAIAKLDFNPKTMAEVQEYANQPWLAVGAILAQLQQDGKSDPRAIPFYNQALGDGANKATYQKWASENRSLATAAEQMMQTWAGGKSVEEDHIRQQFDDRVGSGSYEKFQKDGGAWDKDPRDPAKYIYFTSRDEQKAYSLLSGPVRDQYLDYISGNVSGVYGVNQGNAKVMASSIPATALTAAVNNDQTWALRNGLMSDKNGSPGDYIQLKNKLIDAQLAKRVNEKSGATNDMPPVFPKEIFTTNFINGVTGRTKSLWEMGYKIHKDNPDLGRRIMDSALDSAHVEERGDIKRSIARVSDIMSGQIIRLAEALGVPASDDDKKTISSVRAYMNSPNFRTVFSQAGNISLAIKYADNLADSVGVLSENSKSGADEDTKMIIQRYGNKAMLVKGIAKALRQYSNLKEVGSEGTAEKRLAESLSAIDKIGSES